MSYWDTLDAANERLAAGDLAAAERLHGEAWEARGRSPGRVFLSEKLAEVALRLWRGLGRVAPAGDDAPGRWTAADRTFRAAFGAAAETLVRRALRLSDFSGDASPDAILPDLAQALRLLTASRLFPRDLAAAGRVLKAAVQTAHRAGQPLQPDLIRHDLPLSEEDRLWLGRKAGIWLEGLAADADPATRAAAEPLAGAVLRLLDAAYFSAHSRLQEERAWLVAALTDRHAGTPEEAVKLYRAFLAGPTAATDRRDLAHVRLVELLGNVGVAHFPVPRYEEALAAAAGLRPGAVETARRLEAALQAIARRRPEEWPAPAWASLHSGDGGVVFVLWIGEEPRDCATWRPGEDESALRRFLKPCRGRLVRRAGGDANPSVVLGAELAGVAVDPFAEALLEPWLPEEGASEAAFSHLAMEWTGAWQRGWDRRLGHPSLVPPTRPGRTGALADPLLGPALTAGLLWRACLARLTEGGEAAAAGLAWLAARGDAAAVFLSGFLASAGAVSGDAAATVRGDVSPESLASWLAPLPARRAVLAQPQDAECEGLPPQGRHLGARAVAIVETGRPAAVIASWAHADERLRVVMDGGWRLPELAAVAVGGDLTLVPPGGEVHRLRPALARLSARAVAAGGDFDLLPLFHWLRLLATHNGDLLDFQRLRPRGPGALPLGDRYATQMSDLPRVQPGSAAEQSDPWAAQYLARARQSRVVAGLPSQLDDDPERLDSLWGVMDGAAAAWVFLDSARVHWQLRRQGRRRPADLHALLARRGARHLSILLDGRFLAGEAARLLATWLAPLGSAAHLSIAPEPVSELHLACGGPAPDARVLALQAHLAALGRVQDAAARDERLVVLLPAGGGRPGRFWGAIAAGELSLPGLHTAPRLMTPDQFWSEAEPPALPPGARLLVPALAALGGEQSADDPPGSAADWRLADRRRAARAAAQRALCALEMAALLASGATVLDLADPRWWRRFALIDTGGRPRRPRTGQDAAACAVPEADALYDLDCFLPQEGAARAWWRRSRSSAGDPGAGLRAWLQAQGWLTREGGGLLADGEPAPPPAEAPEASPLLVFDDGSDGWRRSAAALAMARERGDPDAWILVVAPHPPPGAARLARVYGDERPTCWAVEDGSPPALQPLPVDAQGADGGQPAPFGPIMWLEPGALAGARLQSAVAAWPPCCVHAMDLRAWLPAAGRSALLEAAALRYVLSRPWRRLEISAPGLATPWRRWLRETILAAAGAPLLAHEPEVESAPRERGQPAEPRAADGSPEASIALRPRPALVGRTGAPEAVCPACGRVSSLAEAQAHCPSCGLDLTAWRDGAEAERLARELLRSKLRGLAQRPDLAPEGRALRVWVRDEDFLRLPEASALLGYACAPAPEVEPRPAERGGESEASVSPAQIADRPVLLVEPAAGMVWEVAAVSARHRLPPAGAQALLWPPGSATELDGFRQPPAEAPPSLWYHPVELSALTGLSPVARAARCGRLLELLGWPDGAGAGGCDRAALPGAAVEAATGLPAAAAQACASLARWQAELTGGWSSALEPTPAGVARPPRLRIQRRLVELQLQARRLEAAIEPLLSTFLGAARPGAPLTIDLAQAPAAIGDEELIWLDRFLIASSLQLRACPPATAREDLFSGQAAQPELLWIPSDGFMVSARRRCGYLGDANAVPGALRRRLAAVEAAAQRLLERAVAEDDSLLAPLPPAEGDPALHAAVLAGILLGWWSLEGEGAEIVNLTPLSGGPAGVVDWARAQELWRGLAEEEQAWQRALRDAWHAGLLGEEAAGTTPAVDASESAQPAPAWASDPPPALVVRPPAAESRRVAALLGEPGPGMLVLRGPAGCGKLPALCEGVRQAQTQGSRLGRITIHCPDVATAARCHLAWRLTVAAGRAPEIIVAGHQTTPPAARPAAATILPSRPQEQVTVLLDAPAIAREARYRLCEEARPGRLLVTCDPVTGFEAWEHLLLTTPRPEAVADLHDQRVQARRLWEETREFAAQVVSRRPRGRALRRVRGECRAQYAGGLEECLALLASEQQAGRLGRRVGLVAAHEEDLAYLGRGLAARGWIPVFRAELDQLLLPGTLEFLAAVSDVAADAQPGDALLPRLLDEAEGEAYRAWRRDLSPAGDMTLRRFHELAARASWAPAWLDPPSARARVAALVADAGSESLARFTARPLWAAWRQETAACLRWPAPAPCGPVVCLSTPAAAGGTGADCWVYLCLGGEPPVDHYRVLSRASDRLIVLFQERSPLPSEAAAGSE